jgi:poly-beta-hydroxyalkanoate depolymerase
MVTKSFFRESVGAFFSSKEVFVIDWHDHRAVIYDQNLNYLTEFGYYGDYTKKPRENIPKFV